jgi:threonine/homoserine/homoserine lactone efflux protein
MEGFYLFLFALALGFFAAIPVGGSQIEIAKRALQGHRRAAFAVTLGSISSDIIYGVIALFGLAPLLELPGVMAGFSLVGAFILWGLAYFTIRQSRRPQELRLENSVLNNKRWAYLTGFSLSISNPTMILSWLYGAALAKQLGLANHFSDGQKIIFIAGGVLGLAGYQQLLATLIQRMKHFIPANILGKIYYWLGIILFVLSIFFIYNAQRLFFAKQRIDNSVGKTAIRSVLK